VYFLTRRQNLVLKNSKIGGRLFRGLILSRRMLGKLAFFFGVFTSQSEAGGRTEGRRLSPKTSPKGEFEGLEAASTKCEWLGVRITVRILIFGVSRLIMLIFLIFRAEADTCWSARFARSRVGGVARLFKEISFFFGF
jgi:hypothetical protein